LGKKLIPLETKRYNIGESFSGAGEKDLQIIS
jgi:hypothetical protein